LAFFSIHRLDFEAASSYVKQALEIDSLDYKARFLEGALRIVEGKYELAIQSFRAANDERLGSAALYTNMAIAYLYLKKPKKALNYLKRAVTLEPLNENAVMLFSDLAFSEQCIDESIQILRGYSLRFIYSYYARKLFIEDEFVLSKRGIIAQDHIQIRYVDIKTVGIRQTIIERLLGIGTLHLASAGTNGEVDIIFNNLISPAYMRTRIQKLIEKTRR
jgi:tetratricopeptide (TPR) repeat protein